MSRMHTLSTFAAVCAVALIPATGFAHGGGHGGIGARGGPGGAESMARAPTAMGSAGMSRGMSDVRTVDPFARKPLLAGHSPTLNATRPSLDAARPSLNTRHPALSGVKPTLTPSPQLDPPPRQN